MDITGDVDYDDLAVRLDSYSGADITNLCRDAAMMSMRRAIKVRTIRQVVTCATRLSMLRTNKFSHLNIIPYIDTARISYGVLA